MPVRPGVAVRCVNMPPMLLRRRMSRLARSTVKLADSIRAAASSSVCTLIAPKVNLPALPVARPPATIGITRD